MRTPKGKALPLNKDIKERVWRQSGTLLFVLCSSLVDLDISLTQLEGCLPPQQPEPLWFTERLTAKAKAGAWLDRPKASFNLLLSSHQLCRSGPLGSFVNYHVSVRSWVSDYQIGHWRASLELLRVKQRHYPY